MLQEAWALVVSAALAVLPGAALLLAARQRGWVLVASPLVSYGLVTAGGTLCGIVGIPWTVLALVGVVVLGVLVTWLVGRFVPAFLAPAETGEPEPVPITRRAHLLVAACATLGGALGAAVMRRGMGTFDAISQDWDAVFHAAAVRWIAETNDMSQESLAQLNNRETVDTFYYPDSWHGLSALGWDLGVDSVPRLLDTGMALVPFLLAFGIAALLLRFTRNPVIAGTAAVLVSTPTALIYDTLWRGPLIPFIVGLALTPALVYLIDRALTDRRPALLLVAGIATGGVFGVHPSGAYTAMIFLVPWLVQRWTVKRDLILSDLLAVAVVAVVAVIVVAPVLLAAMAADTGAVQNWPAVETAGQAVGDALLLNHARTGPQWAIVGLAVAGLFAVRRHRELWWLWASGAVALGLFVAAAAYDVGWAERATAPWWNDRWRFAAMVALFVVVLAAVGFAGIVRVLGGWLAERMRLRRAVASVGVGVLTAGAFLVVSHGAYVGQNSERMTWNYRAATVIDADALALWAKAKDIVPDGEFVMNDPSDGSTWMLAMEGIRPYFGGMTKAIPGQQGITADQELLLFHFDEIATDPEVRRVVEEAGIEFVITGDAYLHSSLSVAPGVDDLDGNPAFELVAEVGGSRLYRIVG